ncbi:late competence development ComFB family protein [Alicyclobacillus tolerans]|uniref:late competence development ComFB family protein n=1 Tax=Alicyclobacillus tolerans TaxID=90970 RepID=UPI001F25E280|nr:late competence development ComFB family protein [Alicyclobacillus tolerans]MCF8566266.1 late competence development ComFB family protein [Alicyclobacillus tolerans]
MALHNVTEELVKSLFANEFLERRKLECSCQQCKDDILAIALNRLPPRYVVTEQGGAYVKAQYLERQLQLDIVRELEMASEQVAKHPRHSVEMKG